MVYSIGGNPFRHASYFDGNATAGTQEGALTLGGWRTDHTSVQHRTVHFMLDGLDAKRVVDEAGVRTKLGVQDKGKGPVKHCTGAEMRRLMRQRMSHAGLRGGRDYGIDLQRVQFYLAAARVPAPWEPGGTGCVDSGVARIQPSLVRKSPLEMKLATRIVDSHLHFYDHKQNRHTFLDEVDRGYEAFVGNYDALPRRYLLDDYLSDTNGYNVEAVVWHEFLSSEPFKEAAWAQKAANERGIRHALVALVDFLDPELERKLDQYSTLPKLTSVREHLVWDERNPAYFG
ncbi:hypothetical protein GCT19_12220 [Paraburkholderia sp. CNPSo 3155]|uniref:hypothetical protein n=1 Tax=Paraburkholderia atlantica TaxID=2654982 RepID=UPI00128DBEEE|nr:hypothetical protein [Paraburkholderia atlantica]MPW06403.1 hypothetical protein [Paraburkholderia atlantica]